MTPPLEERAAQAAANIAEREAEREARIDPASVEAFAQLVADKVRRTPALGAYVPSDGDHPLTPYLVNWAEFWAADLDDTEWLLEPLFADGRAHALYAGAKTGKSYLVLAACAALATGRPFLGQRGGTPQDVLYVDYEMTPQDVRERLEEFGYGPSDDLSHLHYALLPSLPPLDTPEGGVALLEAAKAVKARFVVIDTMARAVGGEENDGDTFRAFYMWTGKALKQAGIGWARLDHAGKDATKGQRGSSAKNDDVDIVIRLERVDDGQRVVATHRRMSWYPERTEIAVTSSDGLTSFSSPVGELWPAGTKDVAADLDRIGVPLDMGRPTAREMMREHGLEASTAVLAKALKWRRMEAARLSEMALELSADSFIERHSGSKSGQPGHPCKSGADSAPDSAGQRSAADGDTTASLVEDAVSPADRRDGLNESSPADDGDEIPDPFAIDVDNL